MIANLDELLVALSRGRTEILRKASASIGTFGIADYFFYPGVPGPGNVSSLDEHGEFPSRATPGSFTLPDVTGEELYIGKVVVAGSAVGYLEFYDRIWHNNAPADGTEHEVEWPDGEQRHADGIGVWPMLSVTATASATTATITIVDSDELEHEVAVSVPANSGTGRAFMFDLPGGVRGVKRISKFHLDSASGGFSLSLIKPVTAIGLMGSAAPVSLEGLSLGLPTIHPEACLSVRNHTIGSESGNVAGAVTFVRG